MALIIHATYRGQPVNVRWEHGQVEGDAPFVDVLKTYEGSGEPVGFTRDGAVREASLATARDVLDLVFHLSDIRAIEGDVPPEVDVADYFE